MQVSMQRASLLGGLYFLSFVVFAHHSVGGTFDTDQMTEAEGEITSVLWRNPHVRFSMAAPGEVASWSSGISR